MFNQKPIGHLNLRGVFFFFKGHHNLGIVKWHYNHCGRWWEQWVQSIVPPMHCLAFFLNEQTGTLFDLPIPNFHGLFKRRDKVLHCFVTALFVELGSVNKEYSTQPLILANENSANLK